MRLSPCSRTPPSGPSVPIRQTPICCWRAPSTATCSAVTTAGTVGGRNGARSPKSPMSHGSRPSHPTPRSQVMRIPKVKRVAHVVLYVRDPEASARWYSEVLGMKVSARVAEGPYKDGIFMSFGEYDHDIALFP